MTGQSTNDLSIMIGGDAGQGVESSGAGFALALARAGLHVFALQDYRSRIRGGHNFYSSSPTQQTKRLTVAAASSARSSRLSTNPSRS
jgi:2-oxoglutarate ferredoxin oxidoreductase subunit alpha